MSESTLKMRDISLQRRIRLQNYTKKMTLANKSAIFMHFCIFLPDFYHRFCAVGASGIFYALGN